MLGVALALGLLAALSAAVLRTEAPEVRPWGADGPAKRCVVCHSFERNGPFRVAPNLWGIVGDRKARDRDWYAYSPALVERGGTWTEDELDRFLADPSAFVPGSTMNIRVTDPKERQAIIEFLKGLQ
jgi:cytochrome c